MELEVILSKLTLMKIIVIGIRFKLGLAIRFNY
jgi:hypothetical protein